MTILQSLGIDFSFVLQFLIVIIAFTSLSWIVFAPYSAALDLREANTKGSEEGAQKIEQEAVLLKEQYEQKARAVSGQIKTIFDSYREEALKESQLKIHEARQSAQKKIEESRSRLVIEAQKATEKMRQEIPSIAQAIAERLIGKG